MNLNFLRLLHYTIFRFLRFVTPLCLMLLAGCADDPSWHGHDHDHDESRSLSCASYENAYHECDVDGRLLKVRLRERRSASHCEYDRSWGWSRHAVWVDKGCRADFDIVVD